MGNLALKFAAGALIVLFLVGSPAVAGAKDRRGASVVITKMDGAQVSGELIAVRRDSFLLLSSGTDVSIALTDIKTVRIVRKSKALALAITGFLAGAGEAIYVLHKEPEGPGVGGTIGWAAIVGGAQALLGGVIGLGLGADSVLPFAGERDEVIQGYLDKLKSRSLEGRRLSPLGLETRRQGPSSLHRFRISLGESYNVGHVYGGFGNSFGSWRFVGDVPPEEAGPSDLTFYHPGPRIWDDTRTDLRFGPVSLAYEYAKRWLAEIEWFHAAGLTTLLSARPYFISTSDGKTYTALIPDPAAPRDRVALDSVLAGLAYRFVVPDRLSRMSFEAGAAAGPGFFRFTPAPGFIPAERKVALALRARIAIDYYFVPAFSLGVFADFRHARADFAPVTVAGELAFREYPYSETPPPLVRIVELSIPERSLAQERFLIGARITFRI